MSGRFPGAASPAEFWVNLRAGRESITVETGRPPSEADARADDRHRAASIPARGRLDNVTAFDAGFFGLSVPDACAIDPQHRLFLECAWEAFEDAGYVGERVEGPVAVFAAPGAPARSVVSRRQSRRGRDVLAALISQELNLTGPSVDVQTAGAASLAAVHLACQSLLNGECDLALAGGATVLGEKDGPGRFDEDADVSRDGHCRPFDARASGTVMSSAVACVVLKRLDNAVTDGDRILAVIRASTLNHAGARPADDRPQASQVRAVSEALGVAGVEAGEVSYIEADAAGIHAGDANEILALTKAFRGQTLQTHYCAVGSVKGNIGHAGETAGVAGLVKVILALQHRQIPATLNVGRLNPDANFDDSPFYVNTTLRDWDVPSGRRRIAGVTALGEGGTNVHVVVEEAPEPPPHAASRDRQLLLLSAQTPSALDALTAKLAGELRANPATPLADVAYTLAVGRKAFRCRRAVVVEGVDDAVARLDAASLVPSIHDADASRPSVVWAFAGGDPHSGMGAGLYAAEPLYRQAFDEALASLDAELGAAVRRITRSPRSAAEGEPASGPSRTLPALVAVSYAIGRVLEAWALSPAAMIAEDAGTYAAACLAGVLDVSQAMEFAAFEGQLREGLSSSETAAAGPTRSTVDAARERFVQLCREKPFRAPTRRLVSNATGRWMTAAEATDPAYWAERLAGSDDPAPAWRGLLEQSSVALVVIGSGRDLTKRLEQQPVAPMTVVATLRDPESSDSDLAVLLGAAGRLWAAGAPMDPSMLQAGERRRRVRLPTYPFERQRCARDEEAVSSPVGPRLAMPLQDVESDLTSMWRDVLDLEEVARNQDFFDLGGDSLVAVRLFERIRSRFGVQLPLATLFQARTIASLGRLIGDRLQGVPPAAAGSHALDQIAAAAAFTARSVVAVQPGAGGPPLFVVHGAAGNVLNVRDLARAMSPAQTVLGLQAVGIDGVSPPRTTIEDMAASYLDEVRAVQPRSPYFLAGYSGGGIIAFEMARRLDAAGDAMGLLALIDTFHPGMPRPRITAWTRLGRLGNEGLSYVRDGLGRTITSYRQARAHRLIEKHLAADEPVPLALREQHLIRSFDVAVRRYTPLPWPGRAVLFKAEKVDYYHRAGGPAYGWDRTITGGLEIVTIPADHRSIMLGANASRIAERISLAIAQGPAGAITDANR
jgi:acyl transferase domain-containing protein/thioesterase domain-containing protein